MNEGKLDPQILDEIIRRVVEVAEPEKIILFGSAARGEIYMNLHRVGAAVDAIVVTPTAVERYKDSHALVIKPALREGRIVYESS